MLILSENQEVNSENTAEINNPLFCNFSLCHSYMVIWLSLIHSTLPQNAYFPFPICHFSLVVAYVFCTV